MALNKITYTDKVALSPQPSVAAVNKVSDSDMNQIKSVVNDAIDQVDTNTSTISNIGTYSTSEEIVVGKWIDNKPIYRRIVNFTTWVMGVDLSSWNIATLTLMHGTYRQTDGTYTYQRPIGYGTEFVNMFYRESDKTIQFRTSYTTTTNIYRVSATLEYTKTTD